MEAIPGPGVIILAIFPSLVTRYHQPSDGSTHHHQSSQEALHDFFLQHFVLALCDPGFPMAARLQPRGLRVPWMLGERAIKLWHCDAHLAMVNRSYGGCLK